MQGSHTHRKSHHSEQVKQELESRLNRIEGQIRGIRRLIENNTYCDDVIHQISSVRSALAGVNGLLVENHIKTCVAERLREDDPDIIDEFIKTIKKL